MARAATRAKQQPETAAPKHAANRPGAKKAARKKPASDPAEKKPRIYTMSFASVYPLYLQKVAKKGRTQEEVDRVIRWLTGYTEKQLRKALDTKVDLETFFAQAPRLNPNARLITGLVCGVRVETIAEPVMQKVRWLDKLVDELAKGKKMESILRA